MFLILDLKYSHVTKTIRFNLFAKDFLFPHLVTALKNFIKVFLNDAFYLTSDIVHYDPSKD